MRNKDQSFQRGMGVRAIDRGADGRREEEGENYLSTSTTAQPTLLSLQLIAPLSLLHTAQRPPESLPTREGHFGYRVF